ncbi:MAG: sodium-dependent transporter [Alphaproteobacteria bacterium]|nr:sodium-dependent transporter [Alphaproteobacteria bacterium]
MEPSTPAEQWGSQRAFILATVGAAVGLGNIWRFSYVAGENGGATFLFVYLLCVAVVGLPIVIAELAIGRHSRGDAVAAIRKIAPEGFWQMAGALGVLGSFLIMSFYLVISGWALRYFVGAVDGSLWRIAGADYGGFFEAFIAGTAQPLFWQAAVMVAGSAVVAAGVQNGIEKLTGILMPLLAAIVVGLAIYGLTHKGGAQGLKFLFSPKWELLARPDIYLAALGQAFFSLSIGMALFITYGGYLARRHRIPGSALAVALGDTLMAVFAGMAIFPAVFAFGLDPGTGPRLVFITLPQLFLSMDGGRVVGILFFFLLAAAALSASISGLEVVTAYVLRRLGMRRPVAAFIVGFGIFLAGVPASLGYGIWRDVRWGERGILESMDYMVSNAILPVAGLLVACLVGWRWGRPTALRESDLGETVIGRCWLWSLRVLAPILIVAVFLRGVGAI